jgi:Icc protein
MGSPVTLTVLQVTDTHLFPAADVTMHGVCTQESLEAVLDQALDEAIPDVLLASGDLAQVGEASIYHRFLSTIRARFEGPLLCVPGNHDLSEPFDRIFPTGLLNAKGWDIVGIDTHLDDRVGGFVSEAELQRLNDLLNASTNEVLVVGHHGLVDVGASWLDKHKVCNSDKLLGVLCSHDCVRGYLFGHVHQEFHSTKDGVRLFATPSTCFQFAPGTEKFEIDGAQPGYRWLMLNDDGTIDTHVARLGQFEPARDFTKIE